MAENIRVLFIDDQPDFLDSVSFWMKAKGYEVLTAPSGSKGVEMVRQGQADVVFCDYKMPGMDGVETLRQIRALHPTIPLVILTAHADTVLLQDLKDLHVSGFFSKIGPFDELEQVLEVVVRNVKRSRAA
jgi:CheY-like chemotaxis protein